MPYYLNPVNVGISQVAAVGNGTTITINWFRSFPTNKANKIAYNIYVDAKEPNFEFELFNKSPSFVSTDGKLKADITDLVPGQSYRFGVRPVEYDSSIFDLRTLPTSVGNLQVYPETILANDITATSSIIQVLSVDDFPSAGVIKIGAELIQYASIDEPHNNFVLSNVSLQRGFHGTTAAIHTVDGYDGYVAWDGSVLFFPVDTEDQNTVVFNTQDRFDFDHYAFNLTDGYRQTITDIVNSDLSASDAANQNFPSYDYAGYHRTDPVALINGDCVGSYFGGQMYCADGYDGVGRVLRGISVNDRNTQREEELLSLLGESVCLVKRNWTGIRCYCIRATSEAPDARCLKCYGTGFVLGYTQYFSSRSSDGRIRVKFEPWLEDLGFVESGLDSEFTKPNAWTLVLPAIKKRDFIVRFDQAGNEEFRYEVIGVTRNALFSNGDGSVGYGAQKLNLQRIRKTDIIYQVKLYTSFSGLMPTTLATTIASSLGIAPHSHNVITNEKSPSTWNQITSVSAGHQHRLYWDAGDGTLKISEELGHSHRLIM